MLLVGDKEPKQRSKQITAGHKNEVATFIGNQFFWTRKCPYVSVLLALFCLNNDPIFLKLINSISHGTLLSGLYCRQIACSIYWQRPAIGIVLRGEHSPVSSWRTLKAAVLKSPSHLTNQGRVSLWKHFQKEGKCSGNITHWFPENTMNHLRSSLVS